MKSFLYIRLLSKSFHSAIVGQCCFTRKSVVFVIGVEGNLLTSVDTQ